MNTRTEKTRLNGERTPDEQFMDALGNPPVDHTADILSALRRKQYRKKERIKKVLIGVAIILGLVILRQTNTVEHRERTDRGYYGKFRVYTHEDLFGSSYRGQINKSGEWYDAGIESKVFADVYDSVRKP